MSESEWRPCVVCGLVRPVDRPCPNLLCFLHGPNKTFAELRKKTECANGPPLALSEKTPFPAVDVSLRACD